MSNLGILLRRYCMAFGFATGVTAALLLLMQQLIEPDFAEVAAKPPPTKIEFHRVIDDEPIPEKETLVRPPPVLPPPLVALVTPTEVTGGGWDDVGPGTPGLITPVINPGTAQADGGLMPIAQVNPNYPERARRSGTQGYVVVEFTVDATGAVRNARVIESHPNSIFDRAAVISVERSKYRPRREGGKALVVHGVRKRVSFNLEG